MDTIEFSASQFIIQFGKAIDKIMKTQPIYLDYLKNFHQIRKDDNIQSTLKSKFNSLMRSHKDMLFTSHRGQIRFKSMADLVELLKSIGELFQVNITLDDKDVLEERGAYPGMVMMTTSKGTIGAMCGMANVWYEAKSEEEAFLDNFIFEDEEAQETSKVPSPPSQTTKTYGIPLPDVYPEPVETKNNKSPSRSPTLSYGESEPELARVHKENKYSPVSSSEDERKPSRTTDLKRDLSCSSTSSSEREEYENKRSKRRIYTPWTEPKKKRQCRASSHAKDSEKDLSCSSSESEEEKKPARRKPPSKKQSKEKTNNKYKKTREKLKSKDRKKKCEKESEEVLKKLKTINEKITNKISDLEKDIPVDYDYILDAGKTEDFAEHIRENTEDLSTYNQEVLLHILRTMLNNNIAILHHVNTQRKMINALPVQIDEKTSKLTWECKGCDKHCPISVKVPELTGRPAKHTLKRLKSTTSNLMKKY